MVISRETLSKYGLEKATVVSAPFRFESPISVDLVTIFPNVEIGRHSYMNEGMIRSNVKIGRYCSIGRNVTIAAGDHTLECLTTHPIAYKAVRKIPDDMQSWRVRKHRETEIGHDVWIGNNVVIVPGAHVGTGAVIGANSVVTKDIAPYEIVGGVPARHIRFRFESGLVAQLLASEWWMLSIDAVKELNVADVKGCLAIIDQYKEIHGIDDFHFIDL